MCFCFLCQILIDRAGGFISGLFVLRTGGFAPLDSKGQFWPFPRMASPAPEAGDDIYDHFSYRGQSWPPHQRSCLVLGLEVGLGQAVGGKGSVLLLPAFCYLPHSPPTCPLLCPLQSHTCWKSAMPHCVCAHQSLAGEIPGNLFWAHTHIPCVQSVGGGVYVSVPFCKMEKIQWSYKCVHFKQPPLCAVYITQLQEI